jgi:hypothetical protein
MFKKVKRKISERTIKRGLTDMKATVEAFDEDVNKIPEMLDCCHRCPECRERAKRVSEAFRKHFMAILGRNR